MKMKWWCLFLCFLLCFWAVAQEVSTRVFSDFPDITPDTYNQSAPLPEANTFQVIMTTAPAANLN